MSRIFFLVLMTLLLACGRSAIKEEPVLQATGLAHPQLGEPVNILWLVAEDISPYLPMFGDSTIATPNLSWLASEGVCYDNVFASTPVCAPARAAIATGLYANRLGANHMRTGPWYSSNVSPEAIAIATRNSPEGMVPYEAVPPPEVKMLSEYLRRVGYYCTNNAKEDYQFRKPVTAWDESSNRAHWRNGPKGQPFFSVFNFEVTHESRIWSKAKDSLWVAADQPVPVPPYLPDTEIGRQDIRRMYSNIKEMDAQVGEILQQLRDDGLLEKTIIVWYSDHGGPLPRQKRLLFDSGLKVPMIIRFPGRQFAGERDDRLISFVDFAPTTLSLAGIAPPDYMDGQAFLGHYAAETDRAYIFAAADRFGPSYDNNRAVRDKRFKYIRYYHPEKPRFLHTAYRDQMPIMQELYHLRDAGELTAAQALWFRETKPEEELFDTQADPHEIHDLAGDPAYAEKLQELRAACDQWVEDIQDKNLMLEPELIQQFWPDMKQPQTAEPIVSATNGLFELSCSTPGASIGYKFLDPGQEPGLHNWRVYTEAFALPEGKEVVVVAHRIGYSASEMVRRSQ
ncbi:sulfatase family protein [Flavilitoribacter nigricans]|uniref:Sulfatase n=1 Tax=Flavilitoribacter nigricans (strain ATCC 23147 / DSM 23189 / NBRC 102662 / NCIMB 1420 / SS-2) TaxID=1122177 RepID=A0A2D0N4L1_FLAN2|nr:sulfatase [Flavilitoribacter nigricans]PHN02723.1 sulfatase [Flavilitoribacter nigricans DSM 23189 = NBRC 102662]